MITDQQKEFRKGKIGASDVPAALGVSPFKTPAQLAAEILGLQEKEFDDSANYGNFVEEGLAKCYTQKTSVQIEPYEDTLIHPEHEWLIAHPDYKADHCLVEIKSVGRNLARHWGDDGDPDGVPKYVVAQCAIQSLLTGINRVDVAAYFGGRDFRVYPLEFTDKDRQVVLDGVLKFWGYIERYPETGELPPFDLKDHDLIKSLYPSHEPKTSESATPELYDAVKDLVKVKALKKDYESQEEMIAARIKAEIKDKEALVYGDQVLCTWKKAKDRKETDWKAAYERLAGMFRGCHADHEMPEADEVIDGCVADATGTKPGNRTFLVKIKEEEDEL